MAQRMVEELPPNRYRWQDWEEGTWCLREGQDFNCSVAQMQHNAHVHALRNGLAATTKTTKDGSGLLLRFLPRTEVTTT